MKYLIWEFLAKFKCCLNCIHDIGVSWKFTNALKPEIKLKTGLELSEMDSWWEQVYAWAQFGNGGGIGVILKVAQVN